MLALLRGPGVMGCTISPKTMYEETGLVLASFTVASALADILWFDGEVPQMRCFGSKMWSAWTSVSEMYVEKMMK